MGWNICRLGKLESLGIIVLGVKFPLLLQKQLPLEMVLHLYKNNVIIFEFDNLLLVAAFILFQSGDENKIKEIHPNKAATKVIDLQVRDYRQVMNE